MNSIVSNVFRFASSGLQRVINTERHFHALSSVPAIYEVTPNPWSFDSVRTRVRNYFPKPRERKRVKIYGWRARLSTKNGRRLVMRRILKGRWYLTH